MFYTEIRVVPEFIEFGVRISSFRAITFSFSSNRVPCDCDCVVLYYKSKLSSVVLTLIFGVCWGKDVVVLFKPGFCANGKHVGHFTT